MFNELFNKALKKNVNKDKLAEILNTDKAALEAFEAAYKVNALETESLPENYFEVNAKQMANQKAGILETRDNNLFGIMDAIVNELKCQTKVYKYDGKTLEAIKQDPLLAPPLLPGQVNTLPREIRPALTGHYVEKSIPEDTYPVLLWYYEKYIRTKNPRKKKLYYDQFRQGLDMMDVDSVMHAMIGTNPNSMGNWFPHLVEANQGRGFFQIPKTIIATVPTTVLQLTRLDYMAFNRTTLDIIDRYCQKIFELDENKTYFIKTGVASSKFDFRNAKVTTPKEVRELGEYLLFIHNQDCQMASPLNNISVYGRGTTNEWIVREFIEDTEQNPCIYKGLPLHTEYRVFVDFDTCEVLGIVPYWEPTVMKKRFEEQRDGHDFHDYVIFEKHKDCLMGRYEKNKNQIIKETEKLLSGCSLVGQWSIDIMQNKDDFWLIDMATANTSAFYECVPKEKWKVYLENWIPNIEKLHEITG